MFISRQSLVKLERVAVILNSGTRKRYTQSINKSSHLRWAVTYMETNGHFLPALLRTVHTILKTLAASFTVP